MEVFMKKVIVLFLSLFYTVIAINILQAQTSVNAGGGNATGSGGSASYSVGQIFNLSVNSTTGSINEGVQHPFELFTTDVDNIESFLKIFNVYPNPVTETLYLQKRESNAEITIYRLLNADGKMLRTGVLTTDLLSIDIHSYAASVYFLEIIQKDKNPQTFKIIKH